MTANGNSAYGLFYPPHNSDYAGLANKRPPLLVKCHGGPTGSASSVLDLTTQFPHDEIARLEAQIDELAARIESCRKFILIGRIAVAPGTVMLLAILVGAIRADPSVLGLAAAAVLGGIVAAG